MNESETRPIKTTRQWIQFALGELGVAGREMGYESPTYHTVCFLCQSAAEKLLKGFLIYQGWSLKKTHDIVALLAICSDYDPALAAMAEEGAILNEYITAGRYPEDIAYEQIGKKQANEAMKAAEKIRDRVLHLLQTILG